MNMPKKILVVDDDPELIGVLKTELAKAGFETLYAAEGEQGIELAKTEHPDLILADIVMPRMDGLQMIKKIKAAPETANTPIIILTNLSEVDPLGKAFDLGVHDYFVKSKSDPKELVQKIQQRLSDDWQPA